MRHYKKIIILLLQCVVLMAYGQQHHLKYSKAVEENIKSVENSLAGWVNIDDTSSVWNLQQRMSYYRVKGLSIAVIHHYRLAWARGYGWADQAAHRRVTPATLFQAGSVSKSVNAMGMLKLVEEKKLGLDDDINHYLKSWKFPYDSVSRGKIITLQELLAHNAGLNVHGFPGYAADAPLPTIYQVLNGEKPAVTPTIRSLEEPGTRYRYSGGGTMITQLMAMDVTGIPYAQYMWENVLKPLGMYRSSYAQPPLPAKQAQEAIAYIWSNGQVKGGHNIYPEQAAAGLWTNPSDLAKYIIETELAYSGKSAKVLSPAMTRSRFKIVADTAGTGLFITKKKGAIYFNHSGSDLGFKTLFYGSLKGGDGVVIMINSSENARLMYEVANSVARVYHWPGFYAPEHRRTIKIPVDSLDRYTGSYVQGGDTLSIQRKGSLLYYAANFSDVDHFEVLHFLTHTRFFLYEDGPRPFDFNRDARGVIQSLTIRLPDQPERLFTRQAKTVDFTNRF